jgi:hypothetical protein
MKLMRSCLLFIGSLSLIGGFGGCGSADLEALPSKPVVESGEKVIVEGVEPVARKKGLTEVQGPKQHP